MRTSLVLALTLVACGGGLAAPEPPDADVFTDASTTPPSALETLVVPAGTAEVGWFVVSATTHAWLRPTDCHEGLPRTFYVNAFRLMRTEVTRAMWARCMKEGICEGPRGYSASGGLDSVAPPANPVEPVSVTWSQARGFCQHYGGDLPSDAQWVRAATGGARGWGVPAVREAWDRCFAGESLPICADLKETRVFGAGRLVAVGSTPWDIGPYGHADLWGNAGEWTRSATFPTDDAFCALQDGSADPVSYLPLSTYWWAHSLHLGDVLGNVLLKYPNLPPSNTSAGLGWTIAMLSADKELAKDRVLQDTGLRCAFPVGN